ncbi:MAG: hypothetical protein FWG61_01935 [Firmicutes bacterium]|nr:hypothetical protein [Bacillota bacterium]
MSFNNLRKHITKRVIYIGLNVLACLVFCILVLGQHASGFFWGSSSASTTANSILQAADIKLELTDYSENQVINFLDTKPAIQNQIDLLTEIDSFNEQEGIDEFFTAWCIDNLPVENNDELIESETAAQFSILQRSYTFKNISKAPVYFRIDRAGVTNGMNIALAAFWNRGVGTEQSVFPYDSESGFYYHRAPLFVGQDITITFIAFILNTGGASGSFDFRPVFAEIIQATNNAVFMAEGWKSFAPELMQYVAIAPEDITDGGGGGDLEQDNDDPIKNGGNNGEGNGQGNNGGTNNGGTNNGNGNEQGNNGGTNNGGTNNGNGNEQGNNGGTNNGGTNNGNGNEQGNNDETNNNGGDIGNENGQNENEQANNSLNDLSENNEVSYNSEVDSGVLE